MITMKITFMNITWKKLYGPHVIVTFKAMENEREYDVGDLVLDEPNWFILKSALVAANLPVEEEAR